MLIASRRRWYILYSDGVPRHLIRVQCAQENKVMTGLLPVSGSGLLKHASEVLALTKYSQSAVQ